MKTLLLAAAALSVATSAAAVTTVVSNTIYPAVAVPSGYTIVDDFSTAAGLSGGYQLVTGSLLNSYATPLGDSTQYLAVLAGQTATLTLAKPATGLSLYWGSVDTYNTISFFSGTTQVGSFTGGMIDTTAAGGVTAPGDNRRVTFNFGGALVDSVRFTTTANAFEVDDVATTTAVPEPATWALLMVGFGMVGYSVRRRSRTVAA